MAAEVKSRPESGQPAANEMEAAAWRRFWLGAGLVTLLWSPWLVSWVRFALADELASYVLLIPFVAGSLFWTARGTAPRSATRSTPGAVLALVAAAALLAAGFASRGATDVTRHDFLGPGILAFVSALVAVAFLTLGRETVRHLAFPLGFLAFAAPLPSWAVNALEVFFQHTSAEVASWMMQMVGLPNFRHGLVFQLAGITIQVAQECSGIRSSLVLIIVSVYGGHLFLKSTLRRTLFALFVIPLAIARNAFRILTIAELCTHVGSHMIDSPIHHRGGPIFFSLSLVPLFLWLYWLRRSERKLSPAGPSPSPSPAATSPNPKPHPLLPGNG